MATLGNYMHWLHREGGHCRSGIAADPVIGMVPVTKFVAPSGRSVVYSGGDQGEELSAYMIEYLDRRLGMISPFRSVPRA